MEATASATAASAHANSDQSRGNAGRRPRRGRGQRGQARGGETSSLSLRPASIPPPAAAAGEPTPNHSDGQSRQRGRGGRGRASSRGRGGKHTENRTVNGRAFGGQLTREETNTSETSAGQANLQGSAPVFVPGQQHVQNIPQTQPQPKAARQPRPAKRRMSKSQAPDIATRTHQDIDNGHYECAICTSEVRRTSKVWSCHTCWTVFHIHCIKKWSSNAGASMAQQNQQEGEAPAIRQWRCPGCNLPKDALPSSYTCWCEKEAEPRPLAGLPPHSCGQTCGKERARKCPHPCQLTCHAGPCPPCTHMGDTQSCYCGKHTTTKRCAETNYTSGFSCGEICGAEMHCGEHYCARPCHDGPCGSCDVRIPARCYCGGVDKDVLCSDRGDPKDSRKTHKTDDGELVSENWTGIFDCGNLCRRPFDCGVHHCENACHPQEAQPAHCPRSPDVVTHCTCGKTSLTDLAVDTRLTCVEPIPSCDKACDKVLPCGHSCPAVCHSGDCPSCLQVVTIACRCGRTSHNTICHQGKDEPPQCMRVCRTNLNCARHMCEERCCEGERKAVERQSSKKKRRPLNATSRNAEDNFEPEHICTRECGRLLTCGNHNCEELCHRGPCGTCREAIFEEISCHCGRTTLQPPLPCGTSPPPCRLPCDRPKPCGHPQTAHSCHLDGESCPRCPFLVEKRCMCGKKTLKNQQCWLRDVGCGEVCGKKLSCGVHSCRKPCHRNGDCEDANGWQCQQPCGKEKKVCGHPDEQPCHAPFPCKEEKPCQNKMFITCECQAQKQEVKCGASKSSDGNLHKSLSCNDECARLERNRKLALALNVDPNTHVDGGDHIPYSTETLTLFSQHMKWAQNQEREFRVFATSEDEKRLRFKPMQAQQRAFIHSLAEDFRLDSDSVDPEPHRHVMIWKTPRFVSAPTKTLAEAWRIRQQAQRSANASANASDTEGANPPKSKAKTFEPFNSFRITNPRFGLTIEEVRQELDNVLHASTPLTFDIEFLPSEDVILKAISRTLSPQDLERMLQNLKNHFATAIAAKNYGSTQLCTTDSSLNIIRYESDGSTEEGWSKVAGKKGGPKIVVQDSVGSTNAFAALGSGKVTFAKKPKAKPKPEIVADDWETAEMAEEEKERVTSASEDDGGVPTPAITSDDDGHALVQDGMVASNGLEEPTSEARDWAAETSSARPLQPNLLICELHAPHQVSFA